MDSCDLFNNILSGTSLALDSRIPVNNAKSYG